LHGLNLDQLRTFLDVVELGSFSAAANRQKLSQPAISLQIRQLEKRLNVRLIERVGRKARPTAAGADLLDHARRIDSEVAAALDRMARHAAGAAGRVRIGTGATACIFLLPPALRELRRRFPELDITVETGNTPDIVKAVQDNLLDVGLITLPASGRMLEFTPLIEDEFVAVAAAHTKLPDKVTPAIVSRLPLLLFEPAGNTRRLVDTWLGEADIPVRPVMSLGSVEAIKELVSAGLGCAVLPRLALSRERENRDLVIRPLSPSLHRTLALVVRADKQLHRGLRETLRALKGLAAKS
jgi:DNA-binding transcriptional LysR family regulator